MIVFGRHEQKVLDQLARCIAPEEGARGVLCADGHFGYSQPVGGAVAYREHISPAGVGYDIGCGNKAVRTQLTAEDIDGQVPGLMDDIERRISFGVGLQNNERADHPVLDEIRDAALPEQRAMLDKASKQLGTVGGGNHYVDLFVDDESMVWIGVHFGSRGFGHSTASMFFGEGGMDSPPELLHVDSERGQAYIEAMRLAGRYAYAGRDSVVEKVLAILGTTPQLEIHNHHNFAWREEHEGEQWWVVRKGCTPAFPGQQGFVGSTMAEPSVILEGVESPRSAEAFYSTVHGAGRAMSRTAAAGKSRKRWACNNRDCDWVQPPRSHKPDPCPQCGGASMSKRWVRETEGAIDWRGVEADLAERRIELRGANAEEAPGAYKRLSEVLFHHEGTVRVLRELRPVGVAMAPSGVPADD